MQNQYYIKNELSEFLKLGDTTSPYSLEFIIKKINNNNCKINNIKKYFPDFKYCICGSCTINKSILIEYIKNNMLTDMTIDYLKSININYYEYNQLPIYINKL
jgi:hypothetical protein